MNRLQEELEQWLGRGMNDPRQFARSVYPPLNLWQEKGMWHRHERGHGSFSRMGELPQYVDSDKVTAELKHGVLTITLPKRQEAKARRIEVKAS
jgi:hypothetical protein